MALLNQDLTLKSDNEVSYWTNVNAGLTSGYGKKQLKVTIDYSWSGLTAGTSIADSVVLQEGAFGQNKYLGNSRVLLYTLLPSDGTASGSSSVQLLSRVVDSEIDGNISGSGLSIYSHLQPSLSGTFTITHLRIEVVDPQADPVVTRQMTPKFNGILSNVQSWTAAPLNGMGGMITKYRTYQKPFYLYFDMVTTNQIGGSREYSLNIDSGSTNSVNAYMLLPQLGMQTIMRLDVPGYYRIVFKISPYLDLSPIMKYANQFNLLLIGKNMGNEILYIRNIGIAPEDEGLVSENVNHYRYAYSLTNFGYHGCHHGGAGLTMNGNSWDDQLGAVATDSFWVDIIVDEGGYHGQSYFYGYNMVALVPGYYTFSALIQWQNTGVDFKVIRGNDQNGKLVDEAMIANSSSSKNSWDGTKLANYAPVKYTFYVNEPGHYTLSISSTSTQDCVDIILPNLEHGRWATGAMGGGDSIDQWYCAGGYQQSQTVYTQPAVKTTAENNKIDYNNLTTINNLAYDEDSIIYNDTMNQSAFKWTTKNSTTISYNNGGWLDVGMASDSSSISTTTNDNSGNMDLIIWARLNPTNSFDTEPLFVDANNDGGQGGITIDSYDWKPYAVQVNAPTLWLHEDSIDLTYGGASYNFQIARIVGLHTQR